MTGALRILGKATYVWNYKQCTKYWPLVQNVGSLSSRTSQGPISTLTGSLESHSRTHINRATKGTPMRLLFYFSGCGACVCSLSLRNRWITTTLVKLGILYFCPPRCLGPDSDFHIRVKANMPYGCSLPLSFFSSAALSSCCHLRPNSMLTKKLACFLNLGASRGKNRTLISTSLRNYLFPYLLSWSRVFLVPTPRYSLHNMLWNCVL